MHCTKPQRLAMGRDGWKGVEFLDDVAVAAESTRFARLTDLRDLPKTSPEPFSWEHASGFVMSEEGVRMNGVWEMVKEVESREAEAAPRQQGWCFAQKRVRAKAFWANGRASDI